MFSNKSIYALEAVVALAQKTGKSPVPACEIAKHHGIPHKFLQLILLKLRNQGIVLSRKGAGGGYLLRRSPNLITVGQLIRLVDGSFVQPNGFPKAMYRSSSKPGNRRACAVRILMKQVHDATVKVLDSTTVAELAQRVEVSGDGNEATPARRADF
jgi:Rrf2 family protein